MCREGLAESDAELDCGISGLGAFKPPPPNLTCAETLAHIRTLPVEEEPEVRVSSNTNKLMPQRKLVADILRASRRTTQSAHLSYSVLIVSRSIAEYLSTEAPGPTPRKSWCSFSWLTTSVRLSQLFGLQPSAAIAVATAESSEMQLLLMRVQQKQVTNASCGSANAVGGSSSEFTGRVSSLLAQLPPLFNLEDAAARRPHSYENAMDAVLLQELTRYNMLITLTRKSFQVVQVTADAPASNGRQQSTSNYGVKRPVNVVWIESFR